MAWRTLCMPPHDAGAAEGYELAGGRLRCGLLTGRHVFPSRAACSSILLPSMRSRCQWRMRRIRGLGPSFRTAYIDSAKLGVAIRAHSGVLLLLDQARTVPRVDVPDLGRRTALLGCCAFVSGDPAPPRPVFRVANRPFRRRGGAFTPAAQRVRTKRCGARNRRVGISRPTHPQSPADRLIGSSISSMSRYRWPMMCDSSVDIFWVWWSGLPTSVARSEGIAAGLSSPFVLLSTRCRPREYPPLVSLARGAATGIFASPMS